MSSRTRLVFLVCAIAGVCCMTLLLYAASRPSSAASQSQAAAAATGLATPSALRRQARLEEQQANAPQLVAKTTKERKRQHTKERARRNMPLTNNTSGVVSTEEAGSTGGAAQQKQQLHVPNDPQDEAAGDVVVICAVLGNEADYLPEWIEFHRNAGVYKFYLYDDDSKDETPAQLAYYESLGIVRRLSLRDVTVGDMMHQTRNAAVAHSKGQGRVEEVQAPMYNTCLRIAREEARSGGHVDRTWVFAIDADEFLYTGATELTGTIRAVLRHYRENGVVHVSVPRILFASAGHKERTPGLVTKRFDQRGDPEQLQRDCKGMRGRREFKVPREQWGLWKLCYQYDNAHLHPNSKDSCTCKVGVLAPAATRFVNPHSAETASEAGTRMQLAVDSALRVNHYHTKSRQEFLERAAMCPSKFKRRTPEEWFTALDVNHLKDVTALRHAPTQDHIDSVQRASRQLWESKAKAEAEAEAPTAEDGAYVRDLMDVLRKRQTQHTVQEWYGRKWLTRHRSTRVLAPVPRAAAKAGEVQILVLGAPHSGIPYVVRLLMTMGVWAGFPQELSGTPTRALLSSGFEHHEASDLCADLVAAAHHSGARGGGDVSSDAVVASAQFDGRAGAIVDHMSRYGSWTLGSPSVTLAARAWLARKLLPKPVCLIPVRPVAQLLRAKGITSTGESPVSEVEAAAAELLAHMTEALTACRGVPTMLLPVQLLARSPAEVAKYLRSGLVKLHVKPRALVQPEDGRLQAAATPLREALKQADVAAQIRGTDGAPALVALLKLEAALEKAFAPAMAEGASPEALQQVLKLSTQTTAQFVKVLPQQQQQH